MIAKFKVTKVETFGKQLQQVTMIPVTDKPYDTDGQSDDNSFARCWKTRKQTRYRLHPTRKESPPK